MLLAAVAERLLLIPAGVERGSPGLVNAVASAAAHHVQIAALAVALHAASCASVGADLKSPFADFSHEFISIY